MSIVYLNVEEIIVIHDELIRIGGGSYGILNFNQLHSAINRPKATFSGIEIYHSITSQAAALMQSIIMNHPFVDGNKRTGFFSTLRFLNYNGYNLSISNQEIVNLVLDVINKKLSVKKIDSRLNRYKSQKE